MNFSLFHKPRYKGYAAPAAILLLYYYFILFLYYYYIIIYYYYFINFLTPLPKNLARVSNFLGFQPNNLTPGVKKFDTQCQKSWLLNGQKIWYYSAKFFG